MASSSSNSKNTSRAILVIVGILVLSALGYFATKYFSEIEANQEQRLAIEELNNEIVQMEERMLKFELKVDEQNVALAEKEQLLDDRQQELSALADRLNAAKRSDKANLAKLRQFESRVAELSNLVDEYSKEIAFLKAQNQMLEGQLDSVMANQSVLEEANQSLAQEAAQTTRELQQTKELASVLKTRNFRYFSVNKKGRADEATSFKRRKLKEVKICTTVIENPLAQKGERTAYLVYENPDGTINTNNTLELSGTFNHEGAEKVYSVRANFMYNRLANEICFSFIPEEDFKYQKGPQYISVYAEGNLIGQGSFTVN